MKKIVSIHAKRIINRPSQIAEYIYPRVGYIVLDGATKGSGFFIAPNLYLTCLHNVRTIIPATFKEETVLKQNSGAEYGKSVVSSGVSFSTRQIKTSEEKEVRKQNIRISMTNGLLKEAELYMVNKFYDIALYKLSSPISNFVDVPFKTPSIGDNIFIGGFPLTREEFTFHKGMVSSFVSNSQRMMIDASILPGHSGSPVFFVGDKTNELFFAGFVNAEVAEIDSHFMQLSQKIDRLKFNYEGPSPKNDYAGIMINKTAIFDDIYSLYCSLRNNLSTGLGVVIHVDPHTVKASEIPSFDNNFLVPKNERMPGVMARDKEYAKWYHHMKSNKKAQLGNLLGRAVTGPKDNISAKEAEILYKKYLKIMKERQSKIKEPALPELEEEWTLDGQLQDLQKKLDALERNEVTKKATKERLVNNIKDALDSLNSEYNDDRIGQLLERLNQFLE